MVRLMENVYFLSVRNTHFFIYLPNTLKLIMKTLRHIVLIVMYIILSANNICVARDISISEFSSLNRLPVSAVHRIFQDSEGYMWYGTVDGLCRDDGYDIKVFRSDLKTPGRIDSNLIECITEDKKGKIWFGTNNGVYILNKKDYSIRPLDANRFSNKAIYQIYCTSDGYIWIPFKGELMKYDQNGNLVKTYNPIIKNAGSISHLCESRDREIYITNSAGIYILDRKKDSFIKCFPKIEMKGFSFMVQDKDEDYFWISLWNEGIIRFNPKSVNKDSVYVRQSLPLNWKGNASGIVLYMVQDDYNGYMWATTSHDLAVFRKDDSGMLRQVDLNGLLAPMNRMLNEIIKDKSGNLWVAAFDQPSFIIHFTNDNPKNYMLSDIRKKTGCNPAVMCICSAGNDIIWMSQERTGICLYNMKTDESKIYTECKSTRNLDLGSSKEMIPSLLKDGVWIMPEGKNRLYRLNREGMDMKLINEVKLTVKSSSEIARKVIEDYKGKSLWIGSNRTLYKYDIASGTMKEAIKDAGWVTSFFKSDEGVIWMCTNNKGFYRIDLNGKYTHYYYPHHFSSISRTSDGTVWLGSEEGGLYSFSEIENIITDHSIICEMNGDQINQLVIDEFNHIWIDTNQKLIEYNPRNGSYRTYLTSDDNIKLRRFIPTAVFKDKNRILFGGIPGICSVMPSNRLDCEARRIRAVITDIKVRGTSLQFDEDTLSDKVTMFADDRNIEISFSTLNYRFAHKIRYAYRIKEIDSDWNYTYNGKNVAYYSSFPKGNYTLQVKATDENGLWSNEITELTIDKLPAFYETWWAYLFYIIISISIVGGIVYRYFKRIERKNEEMWSDSSEMIKMKHYLDSEITPQEPEFQNLDKMLLDNAVKCVEEHLTSPDFDVTALASAMNMSRSTLSRKLKAITGRTPLDFIRNIKMKHARIMLEDKNRNITEIAATLGYFNRKYFTSCFKEEFGITPSEYQKNMEG